MAQEWDIKARSEFCQSCKIPFQDKQQYFSALVFGEQGYIREDYCGQCWLAGKKEVTSHYSQWQGTFRPPPPPPEEALKKETAETLLRRLIQDGDASKKNVMYILAVMLERKRILAERDVQKHDDAKVIVYEHKKTGETFLVPDPGLHLDQLEHVQKEVVEMLGGAKPQQTAGTEGTVPVPDGISEQKTGEASDISS
jgi:hypothetical protein